MELRTLGNLSILRNISNRRHVEPSGSRKAAPMARLSPNPDRDFSAGYEKHHSEIDRLLAEPPLPWDDILDDPVIRQRVGKLIGDAMRRIKSDLH